MKKTLIYLLLAFISSPISAWSQSQTIKNDFAFGQEIEIQDQKSVIEILLPESVYNVSKNLQLMDLAVFNSSGEPVPHSILNLEQQEKVNEIPPQVPSLFAIYGNTGSSAAFKNMKITTNSDGNVIEISSNEKSGSNKLVPEGYLLDASKIQDTINHFQFTLNSSQKNKVYSLKIEGSNDLKNWNYVINDGVIAWFEMNGQKVIQDTIANTGTTFKFYKMTSADSEKTPAIQKIKVHLISKVEKIKPETFSKNVNGKKVELPKSETSYVYDLGGSFPVLGINVKFNDKNSMARFSILAAHQEKGPWNGISIENFFSIIKNEKKFERLNAEFPKSHYRFWKVQLLSDESGIGQKFPEISFSWQPHRLQFLTRGEGPFMLAYGSSKSISTAQTDFSQFGIADKAPGTLKPQFSLGGQSQLVLNETAPVNYKKYILWAILILGVFVIGFMALHVKKNTST